MVERPDSDKNDLKERLFRFSVRIIELVRKFPKGKEYDVISYQLIKSSSSSGANYDEPREQSPDLISRIKPEFP